MLFASAQALIDGISEPNAPFYEFFHITHLTKLTFDQAVEFVRAIALAYGNLEVVKLLGTVERLGRVRAIYDFTGGNHRLLVTFYDFLSATSVSKLSDAFIEALKPLKPYYQEQMRSLSAQQQKIVQHLSMERTPKTVKEIARGCLATSNTVSSQMKTLLDKGFVERIPQGREAYYEISKALFRICYEADLDHHGAPIRLFVDFLGNFYTAQELELRARGFGLLARTMNAAVSSHQTEAELYLKALLQYHPDHRLDASPEVTNPQEELKTFFHNLETHGGYDEIISFAKHLGESKDAAIHLVLTRSLLAKGRLVQALEESHAAAELDPGNVVADRLVGLILEKLGRNAEAESRYRAVLERNSRDAFTLRRLGSLLIETERGKEGIEYLTTATSLEPNNPDAWRVLGDAHWAFSESSKAETSFRRAVELRPDANSVSALSKFLIEAGRFEEAEALLRTAIEHEKEHFQSRLNLADILMQTQRSPEAFEQVLILQKLQPNNARIFHLGGSLALVAADNVEAERQLRRAVELDGTLTESLIQLGQLLIKTERGKEGIEYLKTATSLEPNNADAWKTLGDAHRVLGESSEAEASFRRAVELKSTADSVLALSEVLIKAQRLEEAEALLRTAIEHEVEHSTYRMNLAGILVQTQRFSEAVEQLLIVQKLQPDNRIKCLLGGLVALVTGDKVAAERQLGRAVELEGTLTDARYTKAVQMFSTALEQLDKVRSLRAKGDVKAAAGDLAGAVADYEAIVERDPNDGETLFNLSMVLLKLGRVGDAADIMKKAVQAHSQRSHDSTVVVQGVHSNLTTLFSFCTRSQMATFLDPVLELLGREKLIGMFEQALSLAVFSFLREHKTQAEERFSDTSWVLENVVAKHVNVSVSILLLTVGLQFFKRGDRKALMKLSREERALFTKELGIEAI
jgi:tetratricopeptide (TPR) repeat protein